MIPFYIAILTFFAGVIVGVVAMCFARMAGDRREIKEKWGEHNGESEYWLDQRS